MITRGDNPTHEQHAIDAKAKVFFGFSSLAELSKYVQQLGRRDTPPPYGFDTGNPSWYGTPNMQAAHDLARDGWAEGAARAEDIARRFEIDRPTVRSPRYGVAGASVSVGRLLSGNPEHMRSRPRREGRKVITLFSEMSASAEVSPAVMAQRAVIVAGLCDTLERMGYACEIVAVCTVASDDVGGTDIEYIACTTLKQSSDVLNINDVIFGLGHPSIFRRFHFALCSSENVLRRIWSNQGYPSSFETNEFYLKSPTIAQAKQITSANSVEEFLNIIAPKSLKELLTVV